MRRARPLSAALFTLAAAVALPSAAQAQSALLGRSPTAQVTLRAGTSFPSFITGLDLPLPAGDRAEVIRALLIEDAAFLGFDPALSTLEALPPQGTRNISVYRFAQRHLGLPVLGADVAVTLDTRGHVRIVGDALEPLGPMSTVFEVLPGQAIAAAVDAVRPTRWQGFPKLVRKAIVDVAGEWRPVWEVQIASEQPLGSFHVWVDPWSGQVLQATNHFFHLKQGYAYPDCPEDGTYTTVDLVNLPSTTGLVGSYSTLYSDCTPASMGGSCGAADRVAKPDVNGDYFLLPNEGSASDGFAEVHTYFHINQMHDWFAATGFTGLDFSMPVAVNYTQDWQMSCNAGYGESAIIVGLCDLQMMGLSGMVNFAYDSLSVMHEYSHGAVDHGAGVDNYTTDGWGLVGQQMGLHEGFADFFPAVVLDDPKVGRHVGPKTGTGEYFRTLTDFRACPADIAGEPHEDGQVWGSANWEAYVASGKSAEVPLAVFEGLLTLTKRPTFQEAANAVLAAAALSHPTVSAALEAAYAAHGLMGCGREVLIANGQKVTGSVTNPYYLGLAGQTSPFEMQYVLLVPPNATSLNFTIKATTDQGGSTSALKVYVNNGSHVVYKGTGMTATAVKTASFSIASPPPGPYYILPVGTSMSMAGAYNFEITAQYVDGDTWDGGFPWYPDASQPDAAAPKPDAATRPDAAAPGPDAAEPGLDAAAPGPDASTVVVGPDAAEPASADAAQPAGPDASAVASPDAGGGGGADGCSCGLGGTRDPAAASFAMFAALALASSVLRPRRRN